MVQTVTARLAGLQHVVIHVHESALASAHAAERLSEPTHSLSDAAAAAAGGEGTVPAESMLACIPDTETPSARPRHTQSQWVRCVPLDVLRMVASYCDAACLLSLTRVDRASHRAADEPRLWLPLVKPALPDAAMDSLYLWHRQFSQKGVYCEMRLQEIMANPKRFYRNRFAAIRQAIQLKRLYYFQPTLSAWKQVYVAAMQRIFDTAELPIFWSCLLAFTILLAQQLDTPDFAASGVVSLECFKPLLVLLAYLGLSSCFFAILALQSAIKQSEFTPIDRSLTGFKAAAAQISKSASEIIDQLAFGLPLNFLSRAHGFMPNLMEAVSGYRRDPYGTYEPSHPSASDAAIRVGTFLVAFLGLILFFVLVSLRVSCTAGSTTPILATDWWVVFVPLFLSLAVAFLCWQRWFHEVMFEQSITMVQQILLISQDAYCSQACTARLPWCLMPVAGFSFLLLAYLEQLIPPASTSKDGTFTFRLLFIPCFFLHLIGFCFVMERAWHRYRGFWFEPGIPWLAAIFPLAAYVLAWCCTAGLPLLFQVLLAIRLDGSSPTVNSWSWMRVFAPLLGFLSLGLLWSLVWVLRWWVGGYLIPFRSPTTTYGRRDPGWRNLPSQRLALQSYLASPPQECEVRATL